MKINPNDPWYPFTPNEQQKLPDGTWDQNTEFGDPGVTIRLKLAADFAAAYIARGEDDNEATPLGIIHADKLIDEMNKEADDGK